MYVITGILGILFAIAPFIFGYSYNPTALWTSIIIGGATILVSIIEWAQADRQTWEYWASALLGIVAILSPFVLGFSAYTAALWSSIAAGILITVFAATRAMRMRRV